MTEAPKCRHCGVRKVNRPRGMCWGCFYTPGVKGLYAITSKYARRGVGIGNAASRPAASPCTHPQGSPGRIESMAARAAAGESLFHPEDATDPERGGRGIWA